MPQTNFERGNQGTRGIGRIRAVFALPRRPPCSAADGIATAEAGIPWPALLTVVLSSGGNGRRDVATCATNVGPRALLSGRGVSLAIAFAPIVSTRRPRRQMRNPGQPKAPRDSRLRRLVGGRNSSSVEGKSSGTTLRSRASVPERRRARRQSELDTANTRAPAAGSGDHRNSVTGTGMSRESKKQAGRRQPSSGRAQPSR